MHLRIAIHNITFGGMSSGYKKFLRNIIPRLAAHPLVSDLFITIPEDIYLSIKQSYSNVSWFPYSQNWLSRSVNQKIHKALEAFSPDVIFMPTARTFNFKVIPVVTMIQNMEPIAYRSSNPLNERLINWLRAKDACRSLKSSTRIIAISQFVKEIMIEKFKITPDKISTVYFGTSDMNGRKSERPSIVPAGWDGNFLFTAGSIRPARNLEDLLGALNTLKNVNSLSGLVIAGETPPRMGYYYGTLNKFIQKHGLDNKVCFTGLLDRKEMMWCYDNCHAFVMTSKIEACPNIALEAISNRCMCISNDNAPMPEIFGDSAIYYSTGNSDALASLIKSTLLLDLPQKKELSDKASKRASQFSWNICAERIVSELINAIN